MDDQNKIGSMRSGKADRDEYERGMLISFDSDIRSWSSSDLLLIEGPSGQHLSLHPETTEGDRLYVMAMIHPAMTLRFWLDRIDAHTARLDMQDHHVEILREHYGPRPLRVKR